jgi:hypothetical protein
MFSIWSGGKFDEAAGADHQGAAPSSRRLELEGRAVAALT